MLVGMILNVPKKEKNYDFMRQKPLTVFGAFLFSKNFQIFGNRLLYYYTFFDIIYLIIYFVGVSHLMPILKNAELFDFEKTIASEIFDGKEYPWEVLPLIGDFIKKLGASLDPDLYEKRGESIWVAKDAKVFPSAFIGENTIIDSGAEVRHCAFIRGNAIVGKGAVVGNSTELKNVILFDSVQVPHYNYVGDSVLGYKSHLGAGSITSNVKSDKTLVTVKSEDESIATGLKKFGAMLGDFVEVGCGSVLCPGSVIGRNSNIYPLSMVRGVVKPNSIYKKQGEIVDKR